MTNVYFTDADLQSLETLRLAYLILCHKLHPDKHDESEAETWTVRFREMAAEYEAALSGMSRARFRDGKSAPERERILQAQIDGLMKIPNIRIDLAGCWLWVAADGFMAKVRLALLGFKWSAKKQSYYWGLTMGGRKKKARFDSTDDVFRVYGRERIGKSDEAQKLIGGY